MQSKHMDTSRIFYIAYYSRISQFQPVHRKVRNIQSILKWEQNFKLSENKVLYSFS
jgi:hypothetical protein